MKYKKEENQLAQKNKLSISLLQERKTNCFSLKKNLQVTLGEEKENNIKDNNKIVETLAIT